MANIAEMHTPYSALKKLIFPQWLYGCKYVTTQAPRLHSLSSKAGSFEYRNKLIQIHWHLDLWSPGEQKGCRAD